jgi:Na+-transporting NADH:ubiquinone oxidoreductase subunit C
VADQQDKPARSKDSVANTIIVAVILSFVASILVAGTAILLGPVQDRNEEQYRQQIILDVAGLWESGGDIAELFGSIEPRLIELESGQYSTEFDAGQFDGEAAAKDSALGLNIPAPQDLANIRQRARFAPVYLVKSGDTVDQIILPVYGTGLWSTMRGFLALDPDGSTVRGLRFYEHAETPGLGDQIDKPAWRALWVGKHLFAVDDTPRIEVIRGRADPANPDAVHQVDGISGATLTGRGVTNLVQYWTGPHGFGPYLSRLRSEATGDD